MSTRKFEFGDRVRHTKRPEWGIGSIVKTEHLSVNGQDAQRVAVRFPNAGLKTISTAHAELEVMTDAIAGPPAVDEHPLAGWDKMSESDWLGEVAQRKVHEAMVSLSEAVRDPFNSLQHRLGACLDLFRFERTGASLLDWAVGQSGLDDPLSRFTRHELEVFFDQWAGNRTEHLQLLLGQARGDRQLVEKLVAAANPAARESVRRLTVER